MKKTFAFICTLLITISLSFGLSAPVQANVLTVVNDESVGNIQTASIQATATPNSYDMILSALLTGQTAGQFDTSELSYMEVGSLIQQITRENPEIMYYSGAQLWSNGKIDFSYSVSINTVKKNQQALQSEVDKVLSLIIKPDYTDFDKVKAIHDYIALNTAYDFDNFQNDTVPADSYTAYGSFVNKIAVCDGYTKAAQLLMDRLGIENYYVDGTGNGGLHSWNLVQLDGSYYFMDITWDDPVPDKEGYVRYAYFLITSDQLRKDHDWIEASWTQAINTKYSYFNEFNQTIEIDGYYYYSNNSDDIKLYKIAKDGTDKQKINDVRTPSFVIHDDWIYFSNYSNGGYLYKMKTDGTQLEPLNSVHSTELAIEGNALSYLNNFTQEKEKLVLGDPIENPVTPIGKTVDANKFWTVTFNKEINPSSISNQNIFVKSASGEIIPVSLEIDPTDNSKLLVHAPNGGYKRNTNYILTVKNVLSKTDQLQKSIATQEFYVK